MAIGPSQRSVDVRHTELRAYVCETAAQRAQRLHENAVCTRLNFWKNFTTGFGGGFTALGGAVGIGTAVATADTAPSGSGWKEGFGIGAGAITALGGGLVIVGAFLTQQFTEAKCTPADIGPPSVEPPLCPADAP
jgi:hypothetical protein